MSNRLKALREKQADVLDKYDALIAKAETEKRALTVEERTLRDGFTAQANEFSADIKAEQNAQALRASLATEIPLAEKVPALSAARAMPRYGKLKAFKMDEAGLTAAYRAGMWAKATLFGHQSAAQWCRDNGVALVKAQSEGVNSAGGFLVPDEFDQTVIDLREEYGVFRKWARVRPMASDTLLQPRRAGGVTAYWVAENAAITESQKLWDQIQLVAKKLGVFVKISSELMEDAVINVADDLAQEFAYAFAKEEDRVGWDGTGISTDGGIIGVRTKIIDGTHTASVVDAASGHDTFAEIDAADIMNLMAKLPAYALRNAKFYTSNVGWATSFGRLGMAAGGNTMETLAGPAFRTFQGFPIVIDLTLPGTSGATVFNNVAMMFFGDLSLAVTMGTRRGLTIKTSDQLLMVNDQIAMTGTERVDIVAHDLGDNTTPGPLIALIGNT